MTALRRCKSPIFPQSVRYEVTVTFLWRLGSDHEEMLLSTLVKEPSGMMQTVRSALAGLKKAPDAPDVRALDPTQSRMLESVIDGLGSHQV